MNSNSIELMYQKVEGMEEFFKQLRTRLLADHPSPIHPSAGQPSPLNGGTAMEHRMSPLHHRFANNPSPQHHPLSNNFLNRIPTFEQLSHRQDEPEDGFARRISEDASSVSTDVHAETSWTVCSEESAASVDPALGTSRSPEHPASYHPHGSHVASVASATAPSARGASEAAGLALTQLLPQFLEALDCLSDPQPGESDIHVLSRHLNGAKDLKLMARDAAVRSFMVEMGAAEVLVLLVNGVLEAEERSELMDFRYQVAEEAAAAMLNLSLDKPAKHMMRSHDVIPCVVRLADVTRSSPVCHDDARGSHALPSSNQQNAISSGSDGSTCNASASSAHLPLRELAAEIIHSLAMEPSLREDLAVPGIVKPLVGLLRESACSNKGRVGALYTLYFLSKSEYGRLALAYHGAVPLLLEVALCGTRKGNHLYAKQSEKFFDKAIHALENVCEERSGRLALVRSKVNHCSSENGVGGSDGNPQSGRCTEVSGLQGLFKLLANGREVTRKHAVSILHRIIKNAGEGSEQVLDETWFLLREEKPRPHFKALANGGDGFPKAQQLLRVLFPVEVAKDAVC